MLKLAYASDGITQGSSLLFSLMLWQGDGGCDWNAGVPACNAVASAASNDYGLTCESGRHRPKRRCQAGETPAFQSHPPPRKLVFRYSTVTDFAKFLG